MVDADGLLPGCGELAILAEGHLNIAEVIAVLGLNRCAGDEGLAIEEGLDR